MHTKDRKIRPSSCVLCSRQITLKCMETYHEREVLKLERKGVFEQKSVKNEYTSRRCDSD